MKLSENDKMLMRSMNINEGDWKQIERASKKTEYEYVNEYHNTSERISQKKASLLLGRKEFLSGLARSAFHFSASRNVNHSEHEYVYFDSSRFFRE